MSHLSIDQQELVVRGLVEGMSIRSVERMTRIHKETIGFLLKRVGIACAKLLDESMRDLSCARIEVDEIWSYVGKKQRHVSALDDESQVGDFYTFVSICPETKVVPNHLVGKRNGSTTRRFIEDLSTRLNAHRVQISSDAMAAYLDAIDTSFGGRVDYGQVVKSYEAEPAGSGRYSPPKVVSIERTPKLGNPRFEHISTSCVERQNLTMRMQIRRYTRLTNAFSKKLENLIAATALHFASYNYTHRHISLGGISPAMAAGVTNRLWSVRDLVEYAA